METESIVARCWVVGVRGSHAAFMIALPGWPGCAHAPNEVGDQVRELLLVTLGKLMEDRCGNGSDEDRWERWVTLSARHGFPPWPGPELLHQACERKERPNGENRQGKSRRDRHASGSRAG